MHRRMRMMRGICRLTLRGGSGGCRREGKADSERTAAALRSSAPVQARWTPLRGPSLQNRRRKPLDHDVDACGPTARKGFGERAVEIAGPLDPDAEAA